MGRDPAWYSRLSRAGRDRVDQTLHFLACWALATGGTAASAWLWAHRREFYAQAPIERIDDTRRDLDFMLYGAIAGQVTQIGWVTGLVAWLLSEG